MLPLPHEEPRNGPGVGAPPAAGRPAGPGGPLAKGGRRLPRRLARHCLPLGHRPPPLWRGRSGRPTHPRPAPPARPRAGAGRGWLAGAPAGGGRAPPPPVGLAAPPAVGVRLPDRTVDGPPGGRADPGPLRRLVPPRLRQRLAEPPRRQPAEAGPAGHRARPAAGRAVAGRGLAAHSKKVAAWQAHLVLIDETGFFLNPLVRRTLAPRGQTPVLQTWGRHRDKVSVIAGLSVSPVRRRVGLYFRTDPDSYITAEAAADFLRDLLRHIRGRVVVVWDNGANHKGPAVRALLRRTRRLHLEALPPYAPDLNPVEAVWSYVKHGRLPNFVP